MTDKERRAAKYLPFDAVKGLKERIALEDAKQEEKNLPILDEDAKNEMDRTLFECYSKNQAIIISYIENGRYKEYCGIVEKIDLLNHQITLIPKKKFSIKQIYKIQSSK